MPPNRLKPPTRTADVMLLSRLFLLQYQARLLMLYGGEPGMRDPACFNALLEHARQMALENTDDPFPVAAAYAMGLVAHPFRDGNVRLAAVAMAALLRLNGWLLEPPAESLIETLWAVEAGSMDAVVLTDWLRAHSRLDPTAPPLEKKTSEG